MKARVLARRTAVAGCLIGLMLGVCLATPSCATTQYADSVAWTVQADGARLSELWARMAASTRQDISRAQLTSFIGFWTPGGSLAELHLWAVTPERVEVAIVVEGPQKDGEAEVHGQAVRLQSAPTTTALPALGIYQAPLATQVMASIDEAGTAAMAKGATIALDGDQLLSLVLADCPCPNGDACLDEILPDKRAIYSMSSGTMLPVKRTAPLSSVAPAQLFYVARAARHGSATSPDPSSIAWCFVR